MYFKSTKIPVDDECTQQSMEIRQMDLERDDLQGLMILAVKADERRMEMRRGKIIAVSLTVCMRWGRNDGERLRGQHHIEMREESGELLWNYNDE